MRKETLDHGTFESSGQYCLILGGVGDGRKIFGAEKSNNGILSSWGTLSIELSG